MKTILPLILVSSLNFLFPSFACALPENFVYLKDIDPTIIQEIKYATSNNFVGRPIKGYERSDCILTKPTALALKKIQAELKARSLGLKVYDCYRPESAVKDFITWSADGNDQKTKSLFYPRINKKDFFKLGYVAAKSSHSRGSTVDLTLVRYQSGHVYELDMGTSFDFMDKLSHPTNHDMRREVLQNRLLLRKLMLSVKFKPLETEWWHFTLNHEPFQKEYFNFVVK
jgi:D-alanyl-D-alanine dipeptidase